jgi:protein ImuB
MSGRWLSLWLPEWPLERARLAARRGGAPFPPDDRPAALLEETAHGPRLSALNRAARALGLGAGMRLSDARAAWPALILQPADPEADRRGLEALAQWCSRWTPWPAPDGADGIALDITGCAHLFGGETGLLADLGRRLAALPLTHRLAIADRRAAAWAWARFGAGGILPAGGAEPWLMELPARALRLDEELVAALERLGLRRIGEVAALPRPALLTRFGPALLARLEALTGEAEEPFVPLRPPERFAARLAWPEPLGRHEDIAAAAVLLLGDLCAALERAQRGGRRFCLSLWRLDGETLEVEVRTGRPVRDAGHLRRLLELRWDGLDLGFGVELMRLEALDTAPLAPRQAGLAAAEDASALELLLDQLAARLGSARVLRPEPVQSHVPERAQRLVPAGAPLGDGRWLATLPRPMRLLPRPEPVGAVAMVPDSPPVRIDWRQGSHRIVAGHGPERILPEWWRAEGEAAPGRDFYRVDDAEGRRFWLAREGFWGEALPPRWRMMGGFQ